MWVILSIKAVLRGWVLVPFVSTMNTRIWSTVTPSVKASVLGMEGCYVPSLLFILLLIFFLKGFHSRIKTAKCHQETYIFSLPLMPNCFTASPGTEHSECSFLCAIQVSSSTANGVGRDTVGQRLEEKSSLLKMS